MSFNLDGPKPEDANRDGFPPYVIPDDRPPEPGVMDDGTEQPSGLTNIAKDANDGFDSI